MCGIAGIIGNVPDIENRLRSMSAQLAHRGPDDEDSRIWPADNGTQAAFTHRRLAIIDPTVAGRQPMTSPDGSHTIVLNGEIYNYIELRAGLIQRGFEFTTNTDTEVLLRLFQERGSECLPLLRGMFAFAIRNNDTGRIFIARDRFGIKPLYYYSGNGSFIFSSELRGLLASGLVPRVLDPMSLHSFLSFGAVQEPRTIIEGARGLPPAHFIVVDADGPMDKPGEPVCYWRLSAAGSDVSPDVNKTEAISETRALLNESIRLHLVADVPVGVFLSGGVDSSSIVALISSTKSDARRIKTFTVCFEEQEFSEQVIAGRIADEFGTDHTEILLSEAEMVTSLGEAISAIDQPTIDGINTWIIARATRRAGIKVALSGLGGDEIFGGYPSFRRALKLRRYASPMSHLTPAFRKRLAQTIIGVFNNSLQSQKIASVITAAAEPLASYASMRGLFSIASRESLTSVRANGSDKSHSDYELPPETLDLIANLTGDSEGDVFNRISAYEIGLYMSNMLLRDTDAMSMSSALEVRVPFLDHKLVEWVHSLPQEFKVGQALKQLLVDAVGADLPHGVTGRKKMGFALPFERWIRTSLKAFVSDALSDDDALEQAGLDRSGVDDVLDRFERGSRSTSWSRVWGLAVLVDWCRRNQVSLADGSLAGVRPGVCH